VRVLELFEFAQQVQRPFKAVDLRNALDWPASSTQMILETLVESGHLVFNNTTKHYLPSPRVASLGSWLGDADDSLSGAFEVMHEIASETGLMVALSIENGYSAQCVKIIPGRTPIPIQIREGLRAPLTSSACGYAILMGKTDAEAITSIEKSRELAKVGTEAYLQVMRRIRQFRREGRALVHGRLWPDSCWIAVPTPRTYNSVSAAISAGGSITSLGVREETVTSVVHAAMARWKS
jgi:DNA-binding IclR family transcriptional regulator